MARYIDTEKIVLYKGFFEKVDNVPKFYEWLETIPTADVIEVVRCKDCKWFIYHKWKECNYCRMLHIPWINENGFCNYGERR